MNIFKILVLFILFSMLNSQDLNSKAQIATTIDSLENIRNDIDLRLKDLKQRLSVFEQAEMHARFATSPDKFYTATLKMEANFRQEPNPFSTILATIPKGTAIGIRYDPDSDFLIGEYKGQIGYLNALYFESIPEEISSLITKRNRRKVASRDSDKIGALTNKWGGANAIRIFVKEVWIGMTAEMALESWGRPKDISRTTNSFGVHEQWVYPDNKYLYFTDGILTSWQD